MVRNIFAQLQHTDLLWLGMIADCRKGGAEPHLAPFLPLRRRILARFLSTPSRCFLRIAALPKQGSRRHR